VRNFESRLKIAQEVLKGITILIEGDLLNRSRSIFNPG
jgi:hypothetical protein